MTSIEDGEVQMKNDNFTEKISLWLDNQLASADVAELKAHLADCEDCRETYQAMQQVDHLFRTAATRMAAPSPGFTERFESRLGQHRSKAWQSWLAVSALGLGSVLIFGVWIVSEGLLWFVGDSSLLNAQVLYRGVNALIESFAGVQLVINLGSLSFKAMTIVMSQPLFWGLVFVAVMSIGAWVWIMQTLSRRRSISSMQLLF